SIALCAHRLDQMEELRRAVEMSSCVTAVFLESSHSTNSAYDAILEGALALIEADQATLFIWDQDLQMLEGVASRGARSGDELGLRFRSGEGIVGWVFGAREPRWTLNVQEDAAYQARRSGIKSLLSVPLQTIKGGVLGVLNISRLDDRHAFNDAEIALASTFAHRAAHALQDAEERAGRRLPEPGRPAGPRAEAA
ncbi:MAG: GAF domain-containing protein, partial [Elusimicrobia bacterium]|nr:GAF domain-containing protein [Elusimicrobiota bacterium]